MRFRKRRDGRIARGNRLQLGRETVFRAQPLLGQLAANLLLDLPQFVDHRQVWINGVDARTPQRVLIKTPAKA